MAPLICSSKSLAISFCCKDIDSISFYLFSKKRTKITMVTDKVHIAFQYVSEIFRCFYIVEKLWRHFDKEVNIAAFMLFITCNRAKKRHRLYSKPRLQLWGMGSYYLYIFTSCLHTLVILRKNINNIWYLQTF